MRVRLGQKLMLSYVALTLVMVVASAAYLRLRLRPYVFQEIQQRLWHEAALVKEVLQTEFPDSVTTYEVDELADRLGGLLKVRVTVLDNRGNVWGDTDLDGEALHTAENHFDRPEIRAAREQGEGSAALVDPAGETSWLYIALPLAGDPSPGYVRLAQPATELMQVDQAIFGLILSGLALGGALAIILAIGVVPRTARPLVEMAEVADRMARGDFSRRPSPRSDDEVGDLARALDRMANQLQNLLQQLTAQRNRLEAVLEGMVEGVLLIDSAGRVQLVNSSYRRMFNLDGGVENRPILEVVRNASLRTAVDRALAEDTVLTEELQLYTRPEKYLVAHIVPLHSDGKVSGAVVVVHDVTQLKRLERVRQDFVANVSHELRTPLAAIKGYAETLLSNLDAAEDTRKEFLTIIERHANRMSNLVSDLLALARLESEQEAVSLQQIDLAPLVRRVTDELQDAFRKQGLTLHLDLSDELPPVLGDELAIEQILQNLLDNAIKYTDPGGRVTISLSPQETEVQVVVADTGMGIPPQYLDRIFERFYRVDKARSRELGGTGLGLSIVKHLVQLHGGRVWAESEPGQGTRVIFTLRRAD